MVCGQQWQAHPSGWARRKPRSSLLLPRLDVNTQWVLRNCSWGRPGLLILGPWRTSLPPHIPLPWTTWTIFLKKYTSTVFRPLYIARLYLLIFGHLMRRTDSFEKTLMLVKTEGITDPMDMSLSKLWESVMTGKPGVLQSMESQSRTQLSDWTELSDSDSKESACSAGHPGSIPGLGGFPEEGNGYPLQYCLPGEFLGRGAWRDMSFSKSVIL